MLVTVTTLEGHVAPLNVEAGTEMEMFAAMVQAETGIPPAEQVLVKDGQRVQIAGTVQSAGLQDNDMVLVQRAAAGVGGAGGAGGMGGGAAMRPDQMSPDQLFDYVAGTPAIKMQLRHSSPALADAHDRGREAFKETMEKISKARMEAQRKKIELERRIMANPFDVEAQRELEEQIRLQNVDQNLEQAMEHNPEAFGSIVMLYIDCMVNGQHVKAFVDSGAQSTIMSIQCAERCGIMRLVDKRYAGVAVGVGSAKIVGRVHVAPIKIGNSVFSSSFTILDQQNTEFLLGLDMLRKHQCSIDLKKNALLIGDEVVPFLAEKDIPKRLNIAAPESPAASSSAPPAGMATAAATPPAATATPAGAALPPGITEDVVQNLMSLKGNSRAEVLQALAATGNNAEMAAALLFGS